MTLFGDPPEQTLARLVVGQRYRIRRDLVCLRDRFAACEELVYEGHVLSIYGGCIAHLFSDRHRHVRFMDIPNDEQVMARWMDYFATVTASGDDVR